MKILKTVNTLAKENTYYLVNETACLLIDPGSDTDHILAKLATIGKPVAAILLTHAHYDHIISVDAVREHYQQPPVYISDKEASWLMSPLDNLSGLSRHDDIPNVILAPADHHFQYDQPYELAGFQFQVVKTPGHSHGGVSFIFPQEAIVFSGDALFKETIGRSDLPTSNFDNLIAGIKQELFTLPNHYKVYPGHGWETTIGHEKSFNPFFR
ncbi:MBL fold metallo-hydrolase [Streptococcus cuniculipharyngis]|uniref:MBL fold metallo-hydrolase n=1 Tax=Streptococcus cuniculipharyngis TaxID=1562651 RepID=A0A5C5SD74_9STRE|nr:MBL fold metallo-hydrolase [Streptococcus cuniculipharyngis]TWS99047.1 MBL fold metallo-hydrolase [Streptococcus cuniculipharyngis]